MREVTIAREAMSQAESDDSAFEQFAADHDILDRPDALPEGSDVSPELIAEWLDRR